ncbi:MAG: flavodoxin domain-containing protein [Desulfarculus sp.]|nr:flavodoxin domain-containing protein [Desulfarculus sp.]
MAKGLIVYATRSGQTKNIAQLIAEGMRIAGMEVDLKSATEIKKPEDLAGYDAYVLGSATYHGEMMESMKQLLFLAERAGLEGKCGGAFGAFGWSGEAPERIFNTMKHVLNMNMSGDCLRLKSASLQGAIPMAQDYGKQMATLA